MSQRTIVVCGHGPGISDAVARRFGKEGFAVALVARNAERVGGAASALSKAGIRTAFDHGQASLEASTIADAFWELHGARTELGRVIR